MSPQEFAKLKRGDIVRHVSSGNSYVIEFSHGDKSHTAFRSINVSNPLEWELFKPEPPKPREWWIYPAHGEGSCAIEIGPEPGFIHVREVLP